MFAGIGGFRAGLKRAGGFECVGHCEIDAHANRSYEAIHHPKKGEWFCEDAREIEPETLPAFDLLCGGFPCQSFSLAGQRKGFADPRGMLFFELARILESRRPPYFLFENVPGLLSHDQGRTLAAILATLSDLGYHVEWQVLNSKDFGVPQSRRRVYFVGYLRGECAGKILPFTETNRTALIHIAGKGQGYTLYDGNGIACTQTTNGKPGIYLVGFNRKEGITGQIDQAYTLNASDYRGINRNQRQNAVFVDMTLGNPKITDTCRCLTADYFKAGMSHRKRRIVWSDGTRGRLSGLAFNPKQPVYAAPR